MKPTTAIFRLQYASGSARRRRISPWVFEVLDVLLALGMLATLLAVMGAFVAMLVLDRWVLAAFAFLCVPVVISFCVEASDALQRARDRIAR